MATTLTGEGQVCSYNGVTFGPTTETVGIDGRMVYDDARRTVIYTVYTITVRGYVNATSGTTDATLATIRALLERPGGALRYENKGFGDLTINTAGGTGQRDVVWGPRPTVLQWKPKGSVSCELVWTVEVAIPTCDNALFRYGIMAFNFRLGFDIDQAGETTRTYSGYLQIPQTRLGVGNKQLNDSADYYRHLIVPPIPQGFRRIRRTFEVSEDKCRLDFTIVDEEMPEQPLPEGCIQVSADHTVQSTDRGFISWNGTINATYEIARGRPRSLAWFHFYDLVKGRLDEARKYAQVKDGNTVRKGLIFITGLTFKEPDIYGHEAASFTLNYRMATELRTILAAAGLWQPVKDGSTWQKWATSLSRDVLHPNGNAGLYFSHNEDAIIDLCITGDTTTRGTPVSRTPGQLPAIIEPLQPAQVRPETSWLDYQTWIEIRDLRNEVKAHPLPPPNFFQDKPRPPKGSRPEDPEGNPPKLALVPQSRHAYIPQQAENLKPFAAQVEVQQRTAPVLDVYIMGYAIRVGYPIYPPRLISVGGAVAYPGDDETCYFRGGTLANIGYPVIWASWRKKYFTREYPKKPILFQATPGVPLNDLKI